MSEKKSYNWLPQLGKGSVGVLLIILYAFAVISEPILTHFLGHKVVYRDGGMEVLAFGYNSALAFFFVKEIALFISTQKMPRLIWEDKHLIKNEKLGNNKGIGKDNDPTENEHGKPATN